jgi:UDP-N-acetylmuramyl pentapeptide phosphotransferase/UDP-N-acetylglucosamine-1-phosphate transferase
MELFRLLINSFSIFFLINYFTNKYGLLLDNKKSSFHKVFIDKKSNPPFTGGIFILLSLLFFIPNIEINLKIFILLIFMSGFFSDIGILKSVKIRFFIQVTLVFLAVSVLNKYVNSVGWSIFNHFLTNNFFSLLFTSFCILIVINGTNFIDGLNTIVIGYYLIVLICISVFFKNNDLLLVSEQTIIFFSIILFSLLILNSLNLLYLGDNGAYILAFFVSIILIDLSANFKYLSPFYIVNLLWYPAYETLFSIVRKSKYKKSVSMPDNLHLHQLVYKKIKDQSNFNSKIINTLSGVIINIFNLSVLILATQNYSNSTYQIILILFSVTLYNLIYIVLKKNSKIS